MGVTNYQIKTDTRSDALAVKVAVAVAAGWQPIGIPLIDPSGYIAQAMIQGSPTLDLNQGSPTGGAVGAAATTTALEYGDFALHHTVLTLTAFAVGTSGDNASLGFGALLYTLPQGDCTVLSSLLDITADLDDAVQTDTPEIGLGTVVASGAVSVLGGTATFENIHEGTAIGAVDGATYLESSKFPTAGVPFYVDKDDVHAIYLNAADAWADLTAGAALTVTGKVAITWMRHNNTAPA